MLDGAPAEIITLLKLGFFVLGKNRYVLPTKCHLLKQLGFLFFGNHRYGTEIELLCS